MKSYIISIPAFTSIIVARSKKEALELFWFDYDCAGQDPDWQKPNVKTTERTMNAL
jgi:hypothetical protein